MATLFSHDFTAANTTLWTDDAVGFEKVLGTTSVVGLVATVNTNAGIGPTTGNESIYRSKYIDVLRDYKVSVSMNWDNAAASGRSAGPGVRVSDDGTQGYFAILDSNLGACRMKVVRRMGGVVTDLGGGWVAVAEGAAALNAGVTVTLRVQNGDDGVHLKASVGSNVYFDVVDAYTAGISIDDGGTAGLYIDATCETVDITFDDFVSKDFEDEATSGVGYQTDIALVINGVYYSEAEWLAAGLDPLLARVSYAPVSAGSIADLNPPGSGFLRVGDWVKFLYNNVALSEGLVQMARQSWAPPGGILYDLVGPRQLGEEALIEDPLNGAPFVSFNFDPESEFYNEDRANQTVGDMLAFLYDNATAGPGGLRAVKAGPASGDVYVAAELTALDAKIPALTLSGNILQAEETLLSFMPEYAIRVDPATRIRHVDKRSTGAIRTLYTSQGHRVPELTRDTSKNYTRIAIYGTAPEAADEVFLYDPNDPAGSNMTPNWPQGLNGVWTPEKAKNVLGQFTVMSAGTEASDPLHIGHVYLVVDATSSGVTMDEDEWAGTLLVMITGADSGATYKVRANTAGGKIWLVPLAFTNGTPVAADIGTLTGVDDPAYSRNGHDAAFKEFDLGGAVAKGSCPDATVKNTSGSKTYTYKVKAKYFPMDNGDGTTRTGIRLDLPAVGLINNLGTLCGDTGVGGAVPADQIEMTIPVETTPKAVPKILIPTTGYRGTAYSFDSGKWNGGGEPGDGDPGRKHTLPLNFPDFQNVALQGAEYTKMADAMLAVLGTLAVSGVMAVNESIDTSYVNLDERLRFVDDGDDGTDTQITGYETSDDLWVLQVEFNLKEASTSVAIGTLSAQGVDLDAYRKRYAEKNRLTELKRFRKLAQEVRDCLKAGFNAAGAGSDGGGGPVAGCNVTSDMPGVSMTRRVTDFHGEWEEWLEWFYELMEIQKGYDFANMTNEQKAAALAEAAAQGFGGIEGAVQDALMANKGFEGLRFTGFHTDADGHTRAHFDDGTPGGVRAKSDGTGFEKPDGAGGWVDTTPQFGDVWGGVLSNLGKTLAQITDAGGHKHTEVLEPGSVVPPGGAHFYGPGGRISLGSGDIVPSSAHSIAKANKLAKEGLVINDDGTVTDAAGVGWHAYADGTWHKVSDGSAGTPAYGGVDGGVLRNAGKTIGKVDGEVLAPGSTVPTGGADYYDADPPSILAAAATVPASLKSEVDAASLPLGAPTVLTSGTTFTTGATTTKIRVRGWGGGGGGGGAASVGAQAGVGGGGAAGSYFEKFFTVSPSTGYTYAIGAAGVAGVNTGGAGGNGGSTTFQVGATTATAPGGNGGAGDTAGAAAAAIAGGAAGAVATNGDVNGGGAPGHPGIRLSGTVGGSGAGGSTLVGAGGEGKVATGNGAAGVGIGGGGGGGVCLNGGAAATGGAGCAGGIIVDEYT